MKVNRRLMAVTGVLALTTVGVAQGWSAMAAPSDPQLSLRVASPHLQIERMEGDPYIYAELGTYVGTTRAALQIEAMPAADGTADLWLVHRDDKGRIKRDRKIETPSRGPMSLGLPDFLDLELKTAAGQIVSQQKLGFCPGGDWGQTSQQRLDATGPAESVMANNCGTELTKHIVYGLDKGWAAGVGNELLSNFEGADGDYRLTLKIAPTYVRQFAIPAKQATASLTMTVKTVPCPYEDPEWCRGNAEEPPLTGPSAAAALSGAHAGHTTQSSKGAHGSGTGHGPATLDPLVRAAAADVNARTARTVTLQSSAALRIAQAKGHPERTNRPPADKTGKSTGLPDMVALPAFGMFAGADEEGHDQLTFGANIANLGYGPLVIEGYRVNESTMTATQWEYRKGVPVKSYPAGEFEWDPREGHMHWHFEDIAQYDLVAANGTITRSGKQAFCLAPTDPIDLTIPGAEQRVDTDRLWSACGGQSALWIREVLPAGWGDTYFQGLPGQAFDITGLPNGTYSVRVTTNFRNRLKEVSTNNNVSNAKILLGGSRGERTVTQIS